MSVTATVDRPVKEPTFRGVGARRKATDGLATVLVSLAVLIALIPLIWVLYTVISRGLSAIVAPEWWLNSQSGITQFIVGGGAYHAIVGTLLQGVVCALISIPIGVFVAIYLVEYGTGTRLARLTTFMVDILTGVPSIVAALFVYALWIVTFGFDRSGLAVSLALVLLMVPVIIRSSEEMLRVVPQDLREASYALGVPKWKTIAKIVIPTALSGIVTGIMLGLARVMGETAPVLILVGASSSINFNLFGGPQTSLPLMMVELQKAGTAPLTAERLWGAALTLIIIIAVLNVAAKMVSRFFSPKNF